jgi:hypothetical protein
MDIAFKPILIRNFTSLENKVIITRSSQNRFKAVDVSLLGCNAARTTFWRNMLPPPLTLKMEAVCAFETLVSTYKSTRRFNPEDQHRHLHHRNKPQISNLKPLYIQLFQLCVRFSTVGTLGFAPRAFFALSCAVFSFAVCFPVQGVLSIKGSSSSCGSTVL